MRNVTQTFLCCDEEFNRKDFIYHMQEEHNLDIVKVDRHEVVPISHLDTPTEWVTTVELRWPTVIARAIESGKCGKDDPMRQWDKRKKKNTPMEAK